MTLPFDMIDVLFAAAVYGYFWFVMNGGIAIKHHQFSIRAVLVYISLNILFLVGLVKAAQYFY